MSPNHTTASSDHQATSLDRRQALFAIGAGLAALTLPGCAIDGTSPKDSVVTVEIPELGITLKASFTPPHGQERTELLRAIELEIHEKGAYSAELLVPDNSSVSTVKSWNFRNDMPGHEKVLIPDTLLGREASLNISKVGQEGEIISKLIKFSQ